MEFVLLWVWFVCKFGVWNHRHGAQIELTGFGVELGSLGSWTRSTSQDLRARITWHDSLLGPLARTTKGPFSQDHYLWLFGTGGHLARTNARMQSYWGPFGDGQSSGRGINYASHKRPLHFDGNIYFIVSGTATLWQCHLGHYTPFATWLHCGQR